MSQLKKMSSKPTTTAQHVNYNTVVPAAMKSPFSNTNNNFTATLGTNSSAEEATSTYKYKFDSAERSTFTN